MKMSFKFNKKAICSAALAAVLLLSGCGASSVEGPRGGLFSSKRGSGNDPEISGGVGDPDVDLTNVSVMLSRDPVNERALRIDDGVLRISGKAGDQGIVEVVADFPADIDFKRTGDTFYCTITYTSSRTAYGTIQIVNRNNHDNFLRVRYGQGAVSFPNIMNLAKENLAKAQGDIPKDRAVVTVMNITTSGSRERAKEVLADVKELSDKICRGLTSDYDRLRAISRWVSANIYYDHPAYSAGIPMECLSLEYIMKNRRGVCGSYANITSALCQAQGILCYNVVGEGIPGVNCYAEQSAGSAHEWNYAFVGGRGIWVDSGWNSFNNFYGGSDLADGDFSCKYFDVGNEILALDHKVLSLSNRDFFNPDLLV